MKKKFISLITATCLIVAATGCQKGAAVQEFSSTSKGYGGDVQVTLSVEGEKIISIKAEGEKETKDIGGKALEELPKKILEANALDVDTISGATTTSNAILTAAKSAYAKATGKEVKEGFKPGTYEGEAYGHGSTIRVSVKVDEDKIEAIDVLSQKETPILYDAAESKVVSAILEKQSLEVDGVTGVTVSSKAIVSAVANALTDAVEDPMTLYKKVETATSEKLEIKKEADVVVVGGGGAGLVAAISAAEEGASVIVVEKAEFLGGNLAVFGGIYNSPDAEKQDSLDMSEGEISMIEEAISATPENDDHAQAMAAVKADYEEWKANGSKGLFDSESWFGLQTWNSGDKVANKTLVDTMATLADDGFNWLKEIGVEFTDSITQGAGSLYRRTHGAVKPNGSGFIDAYVEKLESFGDQVEIMMLTEAEEFIMDGNSVVGVKAIDKDGNTILLSADNGVVLSTGGFAGNVELRQKYAEGEKWENLGESVLTTNLNPITGDGIVMSEKIGAQFVDMEHIQLLHLGNPFTGSTTGVIPYKGRSAEEVIFVNAEGNRFIAEDERRDVICNAILKQEGAFYWMIHDSKNIDPKSDVVESYIKGKYLYRADTLDELAELIEIPAENLKKSVKLYNEAVTSGVDELTGRRLLEVAIEEGPFFAAKRVPSAHHTMGGVKIDENAQVFDQSGSIIPGLFAAGEVTGGIHGGNRVGGNAVDDTVVFGRIAGKNAANRK